MKTTIQTEDQAKLQVQIEPKRVWTQLNQQQQQHVLKLLELACQELAEQVSKSEGCNDKP